MTKKPDTAKAALQKAAEAARKVMRRHGYDLPEEKIMQIGNASIEGATIALKSVTRRKELESLLKDVTHVELETDPHFFEHFVEGCQFKAVQSVG